MTLCCHEYLTLMFRVNHWLVLITFLQHTDPLVPHYRSDVFNFQRGALSTLDRSLLGGLGSVMGWIAAHATNGISETHVLHHVTSKIPHYNAYVPDLCKSIVSNDLGYIGGKLQMLCAQNSIQSALNARVPQEGGWRCTEL